MHQSPVCNPLNLASLLPGDRNLTWNYTALRGIIMGEHLLSTYNIICWLSHWNKNQTNMVTICIGSSNCFVYISLNRIPLLSIIGPSPKGPVMQIFYDVSTIIPNKLLNKHLSCWWFETSWGSCDNIPLNVIMVPVVCLHFCFMFQF